MRDKIKRVNFVLEAISVWSVEQNILVLADIDVSL